jgi:hypothetical protein
MREILITSKNMSISIFSLQNLDSIFGKIKTAKNEGDSAGNETETEKTDTDVTTLHYCLYCHLSRIFMNIFLNLFNMDVNIKNLLYNLI